LALAECISVRAWTKASGFVCHIFRHKMLERLKKNNGDNLECTRRLLNLRELIEVFFGSQQWISWRRPLRRTLYGFGINDLEIPRYL